MRRVSIVTVTLNRPSLEVACRSVDRQTYPDWHHYVLGDGTLPVDDRHPQRSTLGFTRAIGADEPGLNMPEGTPNPLLRWALRHLDLGEFVCFLDDDNAYRPQFLARMLGALDGGNAGIALCALRDHRYSRTIPGLPDGRCDNSGFLARATVAKRVPFPQAAPDVEVAQDCEFIASCAALSGWTHVPEVLADFGIAGNPPPGRGRPKWLDSWSEPMAAARIARRGHYPEAIVRLGQAVDDDPLDGWSRWHLGEVLLVAGRRDDAVQEWRRWRKLLEAETRPAHHWLSYWTALAGLAAGERGTADRHGRRALELLRAAVASEPDDGDNWLNLGLTLLLLGRERPAAEAYRTALGIPPSKSRVETALWNLQVLCALDHTRAGIAAIETMLRDHLGSAEVGSRRRPGCRP